jgi:hypothetical protein
MWDWYWSSGFFYIFIGVVMSLAPMLITFKKDESLEELMETDDDSDLDSETREVMAQSYKNRLRDSRRRQRRSMSRHPQENHGKIQRFIKEGR